MIIIEKTTPLDSDRGVRSFEWAFDSLSIAQEKSFRAAMDEADNMAKSGKIRLAIQKYEEIIARYKMNALPAYGRLGTLLPEGRSRIKLVGQVLPFIESRLEAAVGNVKNGKFASIYNNYWFYDILYLLAQSYFLDGQTKKGIVLYELMRRFADSYGPSTCNQVLAWKYIEIGNYGKAIARSRSELNEEQPLVELLYAFGLASVLKGDEENGFRALRRAFEIFPLYGKIVSEQPPAKLTRYIEMGKQIESFGSYSLDHALSFLSLSHKGWSFLWKPDGRFPTAFGEKVFGLFTVGEVMFAQDFSER